MRSLPRLAGEGQEPSRSRARRRRSGGRRRAALPPRCPFGWTVSEIPTWRARSRVEHTMPATCHRRRQARYEATRGRCETMALPRGRRSPLLARATSRSTSRFAEGSSGRARSPSVRAVDGVVFEIRKPARRWGSWASRAAGSRLGRVRLRLIELDQRHASYSTGQDITPLSQGARAPLRSQMQIVFQDPTRRSTRASGSAHRRAKRSLIHGSRIAPSRPATGRGAARASWGCRRVRQPLPARVLRRSAPAGRHRPRACVEPKLMVCDEPVSALWTCRSRRR